MSVGNLNAEQVRGDPRFTGASEMLAGVYAFARDAHAGQRQEADGTPYIDHAVAVGRLLYLAGCSEEVVAAGLLHDTVEDTVVGVEDIERRFGPQVARLVAALTEPAEVHPFAARKEALRRQVAAAGEGGQGVVGRLPGGPELDRDRGPLGREPLGHGSTDPPRATRDQHHHAVEAHLHSVPGRSR